MDWTLSYPKGNDLLWKVKRPGETSYTHTTEIPYYNGNSVEHNSSNVNKVADKYGTATLDNFF